MLQLPNMVSCALMESCTAIDCCVDVYILSRTFNFAIDIDPCQNHIVLRIEKLTYSVSLSDYQMGKSLFYEENGFLN